MFRIVWGSIRVERGHLLSGTTGTSEFVAAGSGIETVAREWICDEFCFVASAYGFLEADVGGADRRPGLVNGDGKATSDRSHLLKAAISTVASRRRFYSAGAWSCVSRR